MAGDRGEGKKERKKKTAQRSGRVDSGWRAETRVTHSLTHAGDGKTNEWARRHSETLAVGRCSGIAVAREEEVVVGDVLLLDHVRANSSLAG